MKAFDQYQYNAEFADSMATELSLSHSDKASVHQYHRVYSHLLYQKTVNNFLEIGLFLNELPHTDLTAWSAIFPNASIYGADIKSDLLFDDGNIQMTYVDQTDQATLEQLKSTFNITFDVILDDASHKFGQTIATFESLFSVVASGGVYLIEDVRDENAEQPEWQQTLSQFETYLTENGYTFEIFQAHDPGKIRRKADPSEERNNLPRTVETDEARGSDSYVVCIYKN